MIMEKAVVLTPGVISCQKMQRMQHKKEKTPNVPQDLSRETHKFTFAKKRQLPLERRLQVVDV